MSRKTITYPDCLIVKGTEGEVILSEGEVVVTHTFRDAEVVSTTESETVLSGEAVRDTVILRAQGPMGPQGLTGPQGPAAGEDEVALAKRIDWISDLVFYKGEANPGSASNSPAWRISRVTLASDDDVTTEWADGVATYSKVWDNRASYTYS